MPSRPTVAMTKRRDGKGTERLFAPSAAVAFVKNELNRSTGESTLRMWRATSGGPAFQKDGYNFVWYRESDLRAFFLGRAELNTDNEIVIDDDSLRDADTPDPVDGNGLFSLPATKREAKKQDKKRVKGGRPRLSMPRLERERKARRTPERPRLGA